MVLVLILFNFSMAAAVGIMVLPQLSLVEIASVLGFGVGLFFLGDYEEDRHTTRINEVKRRINVNSKRVPARRT